MANHQFPLAVKWTKNIHGMRKVFLNPKKNGKQEVKKILADLPSVKKYEGRLGESARDIGGSTGECMKNLIETPNACLCVCRLFIYCGYHKPGRSGHARQSPRHVWTGGWRNCLHQA